MSMTNFVLEVPKQTLNGLLVSWLSLSDVGILDSALCDRACREIFEHSLSLRGFNGTTDALCSSDDFLNWVIERKIKLDTLYIQSNLLNANNELFRYQFLEVAGPTLRGAVINCGKDDKFSSTHFVENISLKVRMDLASDSNPNFHSGGVPSRGAGVRFCSAGHDSGDAQDQAKMIDEAIADLTLWCTNLETFSVLGRHTCSVIPLMQLNPKLRSVTLTNCSKALRCINDLCPHISNIEIIECASVADLELFVLPSQLKRLALLETCFDKRLLNAVAASTSLVELRLDILNFDWADLTTTCTCLSLQVFRCIVPVRQLRTKLIKKRSKVMPHLRTLTLAGGRHVGDDFDQISRAASALLAAGVRKQAVCWVTPGGKGTVDTVSAISGRTGGHTGRFRTAGVIRK